MSSELVRRSRLIVSHDEFSVLTYDELQWLRLAIEISVRGSGSSAPRSLDFKSISTTQEQVCANPLWLDLRCSHGGVTSRSIRCRWCEGCVHAWRGRVRRLVMEGAKFGETFMWTLTLRESVAEMGGCRFDFISERWKRLLRWAAKQRIGFEYLRVIELQKRGTPHYHLACNRWKVFGVALSGTSDAGSRARWLATKAGFGVQMDFQRAKLGAKGVASYMAKYLQKGGDYRELVREDGRAVRRFSRSRGWVMPEVDRLWRYAAVPDTLGGHERPENKLSCSCGVQEVLVRGRQIRQWLALNRREGKWVAPVEVGLYLLELEDEDRETFGSEDGSGGRCDSVVHSARVPGGEGQLHSDELLRGGSHG